MSDDDLYQAGIVDAARAAADYPRLDAPDGTATIDNPLCGDRVTMDVTLDGTVIEAIGQRVRGCLLCEASSALIAQNAPGQSADTLSDLRERVREMLVADDEAAAHGAAETLGDVWQVMETFTPVRGYKSRHECVLLPFEALAAAVKDAAAQES